MNGNFFKQTVILILLAMFLAGCSQKTIKTKPEQPFPQQEYDEFIRQGDAHFAKMHLYGWRKADEFLGKAYDMKQTEELRDKRFLTLCLMAMREKDEGIVNGDVYEKIDGLGDFTKTKKQEYLLDMINDYRSARVIREGERRLRAAERREVDISLFDIENSGLDAYLYLYLLHYYSYDFAAYDEKLLAHFEKHNLHGVTQKHIDGLSPLFLYSNPRDAAAREEEIETKFPDFAEFFAAKGNRLFRNNKLKKAAVYFREAIRAIPDYGKALNGMGNIYYFTVNNYGEAIRYYDQTLQNDELNPVALFGKGVSLHYLKKFEECNDLLDVMLEKQSKFHGEAYYYKAYNHHLTDEGAKAREFIDKAKSLLPHSGEVHFLSGLLYYNADKMAEAEKDFIKAVWDPQYSNCYPFYYLGMIKFNGKDWDFFSEFDDSVACLQQRAAMMERRIDDIGKMELGDREKEWMKRDRAAKLADFKDTSEQMIQQMNAIIAQNKERKKRYDQQVKNRALSRVQSLLKKDRGALNRWDGEKSTLLHKAIEEGQNEVLRYLINKGARLDIANGVGYRPLHWAVLLGQKKGVELLLSSGAKVDETANDRMTPLHDAAHSGQADIASMLLAAGADPYAETTGGKTPFRLAMEQEKKGVYRLLKPLHIAAQNGRTEKVKEILSAKPLLLDSRDEHGKTVLVYAAEKGHNQLTGLLVARGADIDSRDSDGYSALFHARRQGHGEIEKMLLKKGAKVPDDDVLADSPAAKEAVVWHLNNQSWAIKTKSRFIVLDYTPATMRFSFANPQNPRLGNGHISPTQVKNQQVMAFVSNKLVNHHNPGLIMEWQKTIPGIKYIFGWKALSTANHICMKPRQAKEVDGVKIHTIDANRHGVGYLIEVDGLTIFYPGAFRHTRETGWKAFQKEIDYLGQITTVDGEPLHIDIAFLYLPASQYPAAQVLEKGTFYFLEKFRPSVMFTMQAGQGEFKKKEFADKLKNKAAGTRIYFPRNRGDRFIYRR